MTPVGVFFICQNEDKCHFVNSTTVRRILSIFVFKNFIDIVSSRAYNNSTR